MLPRQPCPGSGPHCPRPWQCACVAGWRRSRRPSPAPGAAEPGRSPDTGRTRHKPACPVMRTSAQTTHICAPRSATPGGRNLRQIGGSTRVLSGLLHYSAWCRLSTWSIPAIDSMRHGWALSRRRARCTSVPWTSGLGRVERSGGPLSKLTGHLPGSMENGTSRAEA